MNKCPVVVSLDCDGPNSAVFQPAEDLLRLAQMRRLDCRPVKQIACDQDNIGICLNRLICDKTKGCSQIRVRQSAVQPSTAKMNVGKMEHFHNSPRVTGEYAVAALQWLACIAHEFIRDFPAMQAGGWSTVRLCCSRSRLK